MTTGKHSAAPLKGFMSAGELLDGGAIAEPRPTCGHARRRHAVCDGAPVNARAASSVEVPPRPADGNR